MWSDVLAFLETARFVDLLLPGWIDRTGPFPVHRPLTFDACLQAESGLIQFTSVNNNGGLHIRLVDEIEYDEALSDDPDEELAAASVGAHYLTASSSVRCTAVRLFTNNESVPDDGIFRAAEMTFEDTYTVFFDPSGSTASGSAPATPQTSGWPSIAHPGSKKSSARSRRPPGCRPATDRCLPKPNHPSQRYERSYR